MISPAQTDLLLDLAKLLKKHGSDVFNSLATALRESAFVVEIGEMLETFVALPVLKSVTRQEGLGSKTRLRDQIDLVAQSSPEKANLLRQVIDQLTLPESISLADLKTYARQSGLPKLPPGDRRRVVRAFVSYLADLAIEAIQRHIQQLASPREHNDRDLTGWTRIILDPQLRAKQGA